MNTIAEQLLSAIDTVVDGHISQLKFDKTIQAEIEKIVNLDTGEYKIKYTGSSNISAFANDLKTKYKVGDIVYVTVPEGDFSNKKLITGMATSSALTYGQMLELENSIEEVSQNLVNKSISGGVVAGAPTSNTLGSKVLYTTTAADGLFQQCSKDYKYLQIQGSFLTQFHNQHSKGNYGLEIVFFTKSGTPVTYKFDISAFNGNPYGFSVYSPQSIVIEAQQGYLTGIKSIKLFQENFDYDQYVENGVVTTKKNTTVANIFVKDVSVKFVNIVDLTDNLYYLNIAAPQGYVFTSNITSLDLVARLIYQGENIMNESSCECQWYERDLSVDIASQYYDKSAGVTWRAIDSTSFATLSLKASDVEYQTQYKFIVTYNKNTTMSKEVKISNLNGAYDLEIQQTTSGDNIDLQIVDNKGSATLYGNWYLSYPDGSYSSLAQNKNKVTVTDYLVYSSVKFYCAIYNVSKSKIIATLEHVIASSDSADDITISYSGEDNFRYNANGDVTIEDAEKERTLQVSLTWKSGVGTSYSVEWIGPDGQDISGTRYSPTHSMIENLWVDNSNILHYTIKQKYKVNYNNNTIKVKIITIEGKEYVFEKEILFLKDGDQGTNGTTYIATVRPYDSATGSKLSGLRPLIYQSGWKNTLPLRCYVYKDGNLINGDSNYKLTFKWTGVNVNLANESSDDKKIASGKSLAEAAYVKVQVTINDKMDEEYDIYCSYPIDVSVGFSNSEIGKINIDTIPSYIKYTSSGINPSFYNNNITFIYNSADYSSEISSKNTKLLNIIQTEDGLYYLKPASSFIFEDNTIALLQCPISASKYLLHPIMMYLDTYGNETINGWDGTSLAIDEANGQYIFAPQVGAGEKDSANRFTGVVMGKDKGQNLIGLYGYQAGVNTFGLLQNGKAFFGAATGGGRIEIDGTSGTIYGGGDGTNVGGNAANGMTIALANLNPANPDKATAIKIGAGVFEVKYNGDLTASSADITGTVYALKGKIGSTSKSSSDGWTIETGRLYSGSGATRVEINSQAATNTTTPTANNDFAFWAGNVTAANAKFSVSKGGKITAKEGHVGGWSLLSTKLVSDSGKVGLASSGGYRFWSGADSNTGLTNDPAFSGGTYFYVNSSGEMACKNAMIRGEIHADNGGSIGGWIIKSTKLVNTKNVTGMASSGNYRFWSGAKEDTDLGTPDFSDSTTYFYVNSSGKMECKNANITGTITAESGRIGDWRINTQTYIVDDETVKDSRLQSLDGKVYLSTYNGLKVGSRFRVTVDGTMTVSGADISGKISAESGKIGGWNITASSLYAGSTYLYSTGRIVASNASISGTINATTLTCNSGSIGGWAITSQGLFSDDISLYSNGNATMGEIEIKLTTTTYRYDDDGNIIGVTVTPSDSIGTIGMIAGSDGQQTTNNLGLQTTNRQKSIIIDSARNVAIKALGAIVLGSGWALGSGTGDLRCTIPKENQTGIYARFA